MELPEPTAFETQLMAYLDGEMPEEERAKFERLLQEHPEWRTQVQEMEVITQAAGKLTYQRPPAQVWDNYWEEIDHRLSKQTGWWLMAAGGAVLAILGSYKVLAYATDPWVKGGLALLLAGLGVLIASIVRGHLLERPRDRYRRIQR